MLSGKDFIINRNVCRFTTICFAGAGAPAMIDLEDDEPYLTFSEDWAYAFVERTLGTDTRVRALLWLDGRLRDLERPPLPRLRLWDPLEARVLGLEIWDEQDGTRLNRQLPHARVLWRIAVAEALELEPASDADGQRLLTRLVQLRYEGRLSEADLAKAELLFAAVEEAEAQRRERQAVRSADAPRAPLDEGAGALLGRLVLIVFSALGARPDEHGDEVARAMRGMQQRLEAEEERQVRALRAELGGGAFGLG
jgi:hypothetical protein